ncbi:beta-ketoacyl synthase N-terminal-like domain-containing protein [Streptomyces sp. NPDC048419]|uniref:beta-ketoacyl synthase N-terminal-like domain-containing protein n=1 Tax=Streptomyces sp. NPDC048419 TaxID=3365547 RepID=UPI0037129490
MQDIVITGIGALLPGCDNRDDLWRQLSRAESQLRLHPVPGSTDRVCPMGKIDEFNAARYLGDLAPDLRPDTPRDVQLYLSSLALALDDAAIEPSILACTAAGLFDGTSRGSFAFWDDLARREQTTEARDLYRSRMLALATPGQAVGLAAALLGVRGPAYTFAVSCSSGAVALGHAFRELSEGRIDIALASGHESILIEPIYRMYEDAGLLSFENRVPERGLRPYSEHSGNAFGEGAVTFVLESRDHAQRRGATILAQVSSFAYANNGSHPTRVDVSGARPAELIRTVSKEAGLAPSQIGFVVGHGNGVEMSDRAEINCMREAFGQQTATTPLISVKPIYGHTLGAASSLNIAAAALMLHHRRVIRTLNAGSVAGLTDMSFGGDPQKETHPDSGIALSFGLGGHNAAVALTSNTNL